MCNRVKQLERCVQTCDISYAVQLHAPDANWAVKGLLTDGQHAIHAAYMNLTLPLEHNLWHSTAQPSPAQHSSPDLLRASGG